MTFVTNEDPSTDFHGSFGCCTAERQNLTTPEEKRFRGKRVMRVYARTRGQLQQYEERILIVSFTWDFAKSSSG